MNLKESMIERLKWQREKVEESLNKMVKLVESGVLGGEEDRIWLDQFAVGEGLDICCGDFTIKGAKGVDVNAHKIGVNFLCKGDELSFQESDSLDFLVTNYLDVFPNVLKVLNEWHRVLKPKGVLAIVCCNFDAYDGPKGPLANKHRVSLFNARSLRFYLERAGFGSIEIVPHEKVLRAKGQK